MNEYSYSVIDTAANSSTVSDKPALLVGWYINTALSAHTVFIKDGTDAVFTIPASAPVGLTETPPMQFTSSLICDPDDSSTGSITFIYRDLRA